jgi:hypothetical protein
MQFPEVRVELSKRTPYVRNAPQIAFEGEIPNYSLFPVLPGLNPEMRFPERFSFELGEEGYSFFSAFSPSALLYASAVR